MRLEIQTSTLPSGNHGVVLLTFRGFTLQIPIVAAQAVLVKGRKTQSYEVEAASHVARMPGLHTCALHSQTCVVGHLRVTKEDEV
jgi:hypothetical protein